ncbi:MAG: IS1634 family transposase, partial [Chlorobi bacterium]|nr:IS1634 family transposase [Chlorobiota bacterium]
GKKQIVIGLLTDDEGYPVSVEVFKGNTNDLQTVSSQLKKLKENFGVEKVVFVGDKGMIKTSQIKEITSTDYKWHYLTSITKQQIRTLVKQEVIQLELFTDELVEVEFEGVRYILRRNPYRAEAIGKNREERISVIQDFVEQQNRYLASHERAREEVALRRVKEKIEKLGLENIFKARIENRRIQLELDEIKLKEQEELDGCYVIKTDVPKEELDTVKAHDRYKDLAKVEMAFRVMKTTLEEIRPVYVRKEETTRGHVFIVMLAYMIIKYITDRLAKLGYSKKFIFESLDKIHELYYTYEGKQIRVLPKKLLKPQEAILKELNIKLK